MPARIEAVFVEYRGDSIGLVTGENVVGRSINCRVRFNDPAVSRRHLRFILLDQRLLIEDLGSSNGTQVNGERLTDTRELFDGDVVRVGSRELRVSVLTHEDSFEEQTQSRKNWASDLSDEEEASERDRLRRPTPSHGTIAVEPELPPVSMPSRRSCPRCRAAVPFEDTSCGACGYEWPAGLPMAVTQQFRLADLRRAERRQHPRLAVEIPAIYNSELLCFDAVARDLSLGGAFLATDLLDEVDTECEVTLLPDGARALNLRGIVRRVVQSNTGAEGHPPGMGIEFQQQDETVRRLVQDLVERFGPA